MPARAHRLTSRGWTAPTSSTSKRAIIAPPERSTVHPPLEAAIHAFAEASSGSLAAFRTLTGPVATWLWRQPLGVLRALDRRFRDRGVLAHLGLPANSAWPLPPGAGLVARVLGSLQRDGFAREAAVVALADSAPSRWAIAALINRVVDPVAPVALRASDALAEWLPGATEADLVTVLPIVDAVRDTPRGRSVAELDSLETRLAPASLLGGLRQGTDDARLACLRRLLAGPDSVSALRSGLTDRNPRVRREARDAVVAAPRAVQDALVGVMAASPSPDIRQVALRHHRRAGDLEALREACFDPNVNVRFYARRYLRAHGSHDLRAEALARLATGRTLVGALALLGDLGGATERSAVRAYTTDPRPRVAQEAARTLALLGGDDPVQSRPA